MNKRWIASIGFCSLALACARLGAKSLWLDEAVSAEYAGFGLRSGIPHVLRYDPNSVLYYAGLSVWVKLFGDSEVAIRLPSALFFAITSIFIYLIGTRLFTRSSGLLAAALFTLNATAMSFAQMARGYALLACLVTIASWLFHGPDS